MKNSLQDLNDHLFAQLERLSDEDLDGEALEKEIARSKAVGDMAGKIIDNAHVVLEGEKLRAEYGGRNFALPKMLEAKNG